MCYTGTESIPWTMTPYLALIILLGCHYAGVEVQGQPAIFYPFGASAGDATLYINDDGSSGRLPISIGFPFYGNTHTSLYVSINPHNDERMRERERERGRERERERERERREERERERERERENIFIFNLCLLYIKNVYRFLKKAWNFGIWIFSRYIEQHPGLMSGRLLLLDHPNWFTIDWPI